MMQSGPQDATEQFVRAAVRAFALGSPLPDRPDDDDNWVDVAIDAGVIASVSIALREAGHSLPTSAQDYRVMTAAVELAVLQDLRLIARVFEGRGVPWAVMKGPVLSRVVYAVKGARDYSDLDVLVHPRDFGAAVAALVEHGAGLADVEWAKSIAARAAELRMVMPGGTVLDLHWDIANQGSVRIAYGASSTRLLAGTVSRDLGLVTVPTLSDLDVVLHVLFHGCLSGAYRLRWLLDAQQCVRWLEASPAELAVRAAELNVTAPARAMLQRCAQHLDDGVQIWAKEMFPPRGWSAVLGGVNRVMPPTVARGRRSGAMFYAATRETNRASFAALRHSTLRHVRFRGTSWPQPDRASASITDPGFRAWAAQADAAARIEDC